MENDKSDTVMPSNRKDDDFRSPVKGKDETKQAKVTSDDERNETTTASLRKKISDICSTLIVASERGQKVNDIAKLPAITDLCDTLKQLLAHFGIRFDDATPKATPHFNTLLEMIKKSRNFASCLNEGCNILESLLRIFQPENSTQQLTQLQILKELSYLHFETTDWPKSIEYAQNVLSLSEKMHLQNFKAFKADADVILAISYASQNLFEKALLHLRAYEQYCRGSTDKLGEAYISYTLYIIARQRQEDKEALDHAEKFLEKAQTAKSEILELKALINISHAHLRLFNVQQSIRFSDKVFRLAKKIGHVKMEMHSKSLKATAYLVLGENQKAYDLLKECHAFLRNGNNDKYLETTVLNNISYATLHLCQKKPSIYDDRNTVLKDEALAFIKECLSVSESIRDSEGVGLAHLNMGLVFMECYKDYTNAFEHFDEGVRVGEELNATRVMHNGYCCFGRLHEAKGETQIAEGYYKKALEIQSPPNSTHWGEAESLRFSPDYLLAKQHMDRKNWKDAAVYLQKVIQRCKRQRKSVEDSLLKISFNDKLTKPYQYLQYVYLEMEASKDALVIGEEGRGRDFYDKLVDRNPNVVESIPNPDELLQIAIAHNTAVLFLSQLTVVGRVYCWFIGSDGRILDVFLVPQDHWKPLNKRLYETMHELAIDWRNLEISVEYRGVEAFENDYLQSIGEHAGYSSGNVTGNDASDPITCSRYLSSPFPVGDESSQSLIGRDASSISLEIQTRSQESSGNAIKEISGIMNEISDLFLKPIEHHLENMVKNSTTGKPSLLIIPQEDTFDIPFGALRLKNGKHLCHHVTSLEAFSFHSFIHSTRQTKCTNEKGDRMEESLIVGNPTNHHPELPCAKKEAEMIAHLLGVTPLIGRLATRSKVVSQLSSAPIIHFACHGSEDGRCLYLAPEKERVTVATMRSSCLTVDDVSQLNVNADMVVLSACHSACGTISIEGVLGLARAFLMAGAKSVVTALWAIPDNATMTFMEKFYRNLREMRVGDALSTTMCQMQGEELFKHVVQWGSFKVLGANVKVSLPKQKNEVE